MPGIGKSCKRHLGGELVTGSWGFQDIPPPLPYLCLIVPNHTCHLAVTSTRDGGDIADGQPPSNLILFYWPYPNNCGNSGKLKWEHKHVLTAWDAAQLTPVSTRRRAGEVAAALHVP